MNISPKAKETTDRLNNFMDKHVYPNNETYHSQIENFGADRWQVVPSSQAARRSRAWPALWISVCRLISDRLRSGHWLLHGGSMPSHGHQLES